MCSRRWHGDHLDYWPSGLLGMRVEKGSRPAPEAKFEATEAELNQGRESAMLLPT